MPSFILMNEAQANTVRGQTTPAHACAPIPIANTNPVTFVLPIGVKTDPNHQPIWSLLAPFSVVTVQTVDRHTNEQFNRACTFNEQTWTVGTKIIVTVP
jgi:hypothetical protein